MNRLVFLSAIVLCAAVHSEEPPAVTFAGPDALSVRADLLEWVSRSGADEPTRRDVLRQWADDARLARLSDEELLDLLVDSFAAIDPTTRRLLESSWGGGPLEPIVYDGIRDLDIYRDQLQLYRARWMTQHRLFDEALEIFDQLSPDTVVDPAGLFFYRAVCQSELLQHDAARDSLNLLLQHTLEVPSRFRTVAVILERELAQRKEDDLGHVSRLMSDAGRHLDLGRSGERVQERQQQVIDAIDRLLEEAEKRSQQQSNSQQGSGNPGGGSSGGQGAERSAIHGQKAAGEADRRELKETGSWGMLDRREEAKVRELIRRQFPANYLDIISEYSRRIAEQE